MAARTHAQACPIARALDQIGQRWAPLILRDLALGPLRFTELSNLERGMGPNLLSQRLESLQAAGLVYAEPLPFPARGHAYALTALGEQVRPVLEALAEFGRRCPHPEGARSHPDWRLRDLPAAFRGTARTGRIRITAPARAYTLELSPEGLAVARRFTDASQAQVAFVEGSLLRWLDGASLTDLVGSGCAVPGGDRSLLDDLADAVGLRR